jgi:segregation and condensation protein A
MNEAAQAHFDGGADRPDRLVVDVDGYEGPIDILLTLAREQKVDLKRISILQLADQYLAFVAAARRIRIELAADYLVIAAWLAYLKSRLLLPEPPADDEPSGEELAAALTFQLRRLEAMQTAAVRLMARPRLGREVLTRGQPEPIRIRRRSVYDIKLYDILSAYGRHRAQQETRTLHIAPTELHSVEEAMERLETMIGRLPGWTSLMTFLPKALKAGLIARSAVAATFVATLELARLGRVKLRQTGHLGPLYLKPVDSAAQDTVHVSN